MRGFQFKLLALFTIATSVALGGCEIMSPVAEPTPTPALETMATLERTKKLHVAQAIEAAEVAVHREAYQTAVDHYNRALLIEPNNPLAIAARGRAIFKRDRLSAATTVLDRHVQETTVSKDAVIAEYESWMNMSQTALAIHDFAAASDYVQQAIATLNKHAVLFNPDTHNDKLRKLNLLEKRIAAGQKLAAARSEENLIADGQ